MGGRLNIILEDGTDILVDEIFETEEDAEDEFENGLSCGSAGRETLQLAGRDYIEADIEDCEIGEE